MNRFGLLAAERPGCFNPTEPKKAPVVPYKRTIDGLFLAVCVLVLAVAVDAFAFNAGTHAPVWANFCLGVLCFIATMMFLATATLMTVTGYRTAAIVTGPIGRWLTTVLLATVTVLAFALATQH